MKMKTILNLFFRFYEKKTFTLLKEKKVGKMFDFLAKREETKDLGNFFRQCASGYANKYLYTNDESLKGSAYAMTLLAEKFEEHLPKNKSKEKLRQKKFVGNKNRAVKY